jgi:hypothetical protein
MGLVRQKHRQDEDGVTNEELNILLADESETVVRSRKPANPATGCKKRQPPRKVTSR